MTEEKRLLIARIELRETDDGRPVVEMWEDNPRLKWPSLRLFDLSQLFEVGIDPNELERGQERFVRFHAVYVESERLNKEGNPYKDVMRLEPVDEGKQDDTQSTLDAMLRLLQTIEHYLAMISQCAEVIASETVQGQTDDLPISDAEKARMEKALYYPEPEPEPAPKPAPKAEGDPVLNEDQARRRFGKIAGPAIRAGQIDITVPGQLTSQVSAKAINWRTALQRLQAAIEAGQQ